MLGKIASIYNACLYIQYTYINGTNQAAAMAVGWFYNSACGLCKKTRQLLAESAGGCRERPPKSEVRLTAAGLLDIAWNRQENPHSHTSCTGLAKERQDCELQMPQHSKRL